MLHTIPPVSFLTVTVLLLCAGAAGGQRQDVESYRMARSLALRGELDRALDLFSDELGRGFDPAQALADPAWTQARRDPRFQRIVREATVAAESWIAPYDEPGDRFVWILKLETATGEPIPGLLVYADQTDASGTYGPDQEDNRNPRLWAYALSDEQGEVRFHTIRPAPHTARPGLQHIHYRVGAASTADLSGRALFEDDPLLDDAARERARRQGWPILRLQGQPGSLRAASKLTVRTSSSQVPSGRASGPRAAPSSAAP